MSLGLSFAAGRGVSVVGRVALPAGPALGTCPLKQCQWEVAWVLEGREVGRQRRLPCHCTQVGAYLHFQLLPWDLWPYGVQHSHSLGRHPSSLLQCSQDSRAAG